MVLFTLHDRYNRGGLVYLNRRHEPLPEKKVENSWKFLEIGFGRLKYIKKKSKIFQWLENSFKFLEISNSFWKNSWKFLESTNILSCQIFENFKKFGTFFPRICQKMSNLLFIKSFETFFVLFLCKNSRNGIKNWPTFSHFVKKFQIKI